MVVGVLENIRSVFKILLPLMCFFFSFLVILLTRDLIQCSLDKVIKSLLQLSFLHCDS